MKQEDAGVIPVTENGRLTGMVTDRDIASASLPKIGQVVEEISQ
jgi:CBS domain-containing protein